MSVPLLNLQIIFQLLVQAMESGLCGGCCCQSLEVDYWSLVFSYGEEYSHIKSLDLVMSILVPSVFTLFRKIVKRHMHQMAGYRVKTWWNQDLSSPNHIIVTVFGFIPCWNDTHIQTEIQTDLLIKRKDTDPRAQKWFSKLDTFLKFSS